MALLVKLHTVSRCDSKENEKPQFVLRMTAKQRTVLFGIAAFSIVLAIIYLIWVLINQKKEWYAWFLSELKQSETANRLGITNNPSTEQLSNLKELSDNVLFKLRKVVKDWDITSGFRSGAVNEAIGGVQNSQHLEGKAVDFKCSNAKEVFEYIRKNIEFDQLIWEKGDAVKPGWIHVSFNTGKNRKQVIYQY